jgi:hypothetical protein
MTVKAETLLVGGPVSTIIGVTIVIVACLAFPVISIALVVLGALFIWVGLIASIYGIIEYRKGSNQ